MIPLTVKLHDFLPVNIQQFNTGATNPLNTTGSINTGEGSLATKPQAFYDRRLLEIRRPREFFHRKLAQVRDMPKNYGDTVNFRRIRRLQPALEPLTEGVTPEGDEAQVTAISATTRQYGKYMIFTDVVDFQSVDPILAEYNEEQGHQANETLDIVVREELHAGSNVFYAGGKTSRADLTVSDHPTIDDFRKMRLQMKSNHVPTINGKYVALVSPAVVMDLMDDEKFVKAYEIAQNAKPFIDGEIADLYGIKFVEVDNPKVFAGEGAAEEEGAGGADVHSSLLLGRQAYGITRIKGQGDIQNITKALGSAGTDDPLNQRQSIGWKVNAFVAKRLDEAAIIRYESVPKNASSFYAYEGEHA